MVASTAGKTSSRVRTERTELSSTDFAAEIFKLSGEGESNNLLIYGDSNAGKTVLSGTCPGRTFWLVCEPGYKSAARKGAHGHGHVIADTATALAAVDWLNELGRDRKPRYQLLDWIVLDGLSTMQDRFRFNYAAEAFDASSGTKRQHRNIPDQPDYFNTQNFLKSWIPMLVDMPVNLLITAHAYRTNKTDDGELLTFPGVQGKTTEVANAISGLMDITGYYAARRMKTKSGDHKIIRRLWFSQPDEAWGGSSRYVVGDKFDALGPYMDFPTIPKILEKIST